MHTCSYFLFILAVFILCIWALFLSHSTHEHLIDTNTYSVVTTKSIRVGVNVLSTTKFPSPVVHSSMEQGLKDYSTTNVMLVSKGEQRGEDKMFSSSFIEGTLFVLKQKCDIRHNNEIKSLITWKLTLLCIFNLKAFSQLSGLLLGAPQRRYFLKQRHPTASVSQGLLRRLECVCPLSIPLTSTQHNPLLALLRLLPQFCQFRLLDLAASLLTLESSSDFPQPKKMVCTPYAGDIETATQHAYPISIFHLCLRTLILSLEAMALKRWHLPASLAARGGLWAVRGHWDFHEKALWAELTQLWGVSSSPLLFCFSGLALEHGQDGWSSCCQLVALRREKQKDRWSLGPWSCHASPGELTFWLLIHEQITT